MEEKVPEYGIGDEEWILDLDGRVVGKRNDPDFLAAIIGGFFAPMVYPDGEWFGQEVSFLCQEPDGSVFSLDCSFLYANYLLH